MSISAPRDANFIPTLLGTLNTDGRTVISVRANPLEHHLKVADGTTGTNHLTLNAQRDANRIPALWAISSVDGVTPVSVYADSSGNLLIQST